MVHLTLAGLSGDGKRLLLVSDAGVEFTVDVDARLRAALRGDHARLGQLEIKMDSALRPRDIQARIRSGESPDAVAQAAQTTVDAIMPYAAPVLAEREHMASRAQRASLRRRAGEAGARTLGDAVAVHLRSLNVDPGGVEWDAWRREDGRWTLTGVFSSSHRTGAGRFSFDPPGNYVVADDDDAKWLVGEAAESAGGQAPVARESRDDLERARRRRLSAVPAEELPLGEDALELVSDDPLERTLGAEAPVEAYLDRPVEQSADEPTDGSEDAGPTEEPAAREQAVEEPPAEEEPVAPEPARPARRKGRASVPSWDEIMFGGGGRD
jgi:hypothetical protein